MEAVPEAIVERSTPGQIEIGVNLAVLYWNSGCELVKIEALEKVGL